MDRDDAIKRIRAGLKNRSGKSWSVKGGRGTSWGWIKISAPPARCTWRHRLPEGMADLPENYETYDSGRKDGYMSPSDCAELGELLGLGGPCHIQGESVPASGDYWNEYVDRAEGRTPEKYGVQYWD